jgi:putative membrane protein
MVTGTSPKFRVLFTRNRTTCNALYMSLSRVAVTGCSLWLAAQIVGGVRLADGLAPLTVIGTVLVVAMLLCFVETVSYGLRRAIGASVAPLPLAVMALMTFNALLFWLTGALASAAGLGYTVDGFLPALAGAAVLLAVGWLSRLTYA